MCVSGDDVFHSLRGIAVAILLAAGIGACGSSNYTSAKASISTIDRSCNFIETTKEGGRTTARGYTDSCNSTDEWASVREKRNKIVSGKATVHITYAAPKDGSYQTAELEFDGRDEEFYKLRAGDEIDILVNNDDPKKVYKA
jgi:hypothetical protein